MQRWPLLARPAGALLLACRWQKTRRSVSKDYHQRVQKIEDVVETLNVFQELLVKVRRDQGWVLQMSVGKADAWKIMI